MKKIFCWAIMAITPSLAMAEGILPMHCLTDQARNDVMSQVPHLMDLQPGAATIAQVEMLSDTPTVTYMLPINGEPALHLLQCPVRILWSNGHKEAGWFEEWEDHYGQIQVYFGPTPRQPR